VVLEHQPEPLIPEPSSEGRKPVNNVPNRDLGEPDLTHPWWDSPAHCTAGQLPDLSVSTGLRAALVMDHHKSEPTRVERGHLADVTAAVYVSSSATEEIDTTIRLAEIELVRSDYLSIEGYSMTGEQLRRFIAALGGVLPMLDEPAPVRRREDVAEDGCPMWCAGQHAPDWHCHERDTGEVEVGVGDLVLAVGAAQYNDDRPPVVALTWHDQDETSLTNMTAAEAIELGLALLGAAGLIAHGGAR
jgi:hypothetical protein